MNTAGRFLTPGWFVFNILFLFAKKIYLLYNLGKKMKQILLTIIVILLFIISGFIFWAGLAPVSFFKFFAMYPVVGKTASQIGLLEKQGPHLLQATSSEAVLSTEGLIYIKGNSWGVEIAKNETDRASGLSNRKTLYNKKGMLFVFDKMGSHSFWMKDMLIPIDMIFFDDNWKIILIESNLQASSFPTTFGGSVKSQYVLEVNAGEALAYGLNVGDTAIFLNK